jgi:hypothetical protein
MRVSMAIISCAILAMTGLGFAMGFSMVVLSQLRFCKRTSLTVGARGVLGLRMPCCGMMLLNMISSRMILSAGLIGLLRVICTKPSSLAIKTISLEPRALSFAAMFSMCLPMVRGERNRRTAISVLNSPSHM